MGTIWCGLDVMMASEITGFKPVVWRFPGAEQGCSAAFLPLDGDRVSVNEG